ncbi:hypothetical protein D3C84_1064980 [compost metagenome]
MQVGERRFHSLIRLQVISDKFLKVCGNHKADLLRFDGITTLEELRGFVKVLTDLNRVKIDLAFQRDITGDFGHITGTTIP